MEEIRKIKTACRSCHGGCGVIATVSGGKVIKVEGDPESPISHGTLCSKGLAITQLAYHPDRVIYPLKKIGGKLSGKWERISWDEALNTISERFQTVMAQYGPESIVVGQGTGRDYESHLYRFANLLGTPNVLTAGLMCYVSRVASTLITAGSLPIGDYEGEPKLIVMWGCNPQWTNPDEYKGEGFWRAYKKGAKLICIDPRKGFVANKADLWLQIRPGTDAALSLGFNQVIIEEELYDKVFVENYVNGWEAWKERVMDYPPEKVQEITWIDKDLIRKAARMYGTIKPALIHWGVPTEQNNNCANYTRATTALMGITGNLDVPGGNVLFVNPPTRTVAEFGRHRDLSKEQRDKRLGGKDFPLGARVAFINPKKAWDAILTGQPYPLKAGILGGTNPVVTRANAKEAYAALKQIEFLAVIDFFQTPTTELADIFLPAGTWLEQNHVADNWKRHGFALARQKCVEIGEAWQDHKIWMELGKRMGQEWWPTVEDALDWLLEPSGLNWEQFKEKGYLQGEMVYRKYQQKGFSTPTKKLEIYSTILEGWGYDPLPKYDEVAESPVSKPEVAKDFPYIFNSGLRTPTFFHAANRNIPWLREIRPDPIVEIHPDTAQKHDIEEGDWVYIASPRGRIKQRAKLNKNIDPRVIVAEHGWWFPEIKTPDHGWDISNANILTDNAYETLDQAIGSTNLRVCLCNIAPCPAE
jgi:anaerobic selenocysteine-containing dehydrogenase